MDEIIKIITFHLVECKNQQIIWIEICQWSIEQICNSSLFLFPKEVFRKLNYSIDFIWLGLNEQYFEVFIICHA